jgi:hypothetical protein
MVRARNELGEVSASELRAARNDEKRAARKISNLKFFPRYQPKNAARCAPVTICAQRARIKREPLFDNPIQSPPMAMGGFSSVSQNEPNR